MKLYEIEKFTDKELYEDLDTSNNTGYSTSDLVKIVKTSQDESAWSPPMTLEELLREMESWQKK
jgi:hypothetical protein